LFQLAASSVKSKRVFPGHKSGLPIEIVNSQEPTMNYR